MARNDSNSNSDGAKKVPKSHKTPFFPIKCEEYEVFFEVDCSHFVPIYCLPLQEKEEGNINLSKNPSIKYSKWELMKCKLPMPLSNISSLVFDDYYLLIFGKGI